jgi:hypothetical protein
VLCGIIKEPVRNVLWATGLLHQGSRAPRTTGEPYRSAKSAAPPEIIFEAGLNGEACLRVLEDPEASN